MSTHHVSVHTKISPAHPLLNYTHTTSFYLHCKYNRGGFRLQRVRGCRRSFGGNGHARVLFMLALSPRSAVRRGIRTR